MWIRYVYVSYSQLRPLSPVSRSNRLDQTIPSNGLFETATDPVIWMRSGFNRNPIPLPTRTLLNPHPRAEGQPDHRGGFRRIESRRSFLPLGSLLRLSD